MGSIYRKLVVYFLMLNLLAIGSVGIYSYYKEKEALLSRTFDQLISVRIEKKNRITGFFQQRVRDMKNVSEVFQLRRTLQQAIPTAKNVRKASKKRPFSSGKNDWVNYLKNAGCYARLFFLDSSKAAYCFDLNQPQKRFQSLKQKEIKGLQVVWQKQKNRRKPFIVEAFFNDKKGPSVLLAGKNLFSNSGRFEGMIAAEIKIGSINKIMFENNPNNGLNKTGEVYLVGSDNLMRSNSRFFKNAIYKTSVNTPGVLRALHGITGKDQFGDYRNIPVLSAYSPLNFSQIHWAVLAEIDTKEAMIPIYSIRDNIIYLSLLIALISAAIITFLSKRFTDPLKKLKLETTKIADGEYGNILKVSTKDEIGRLTQSFNKMSVRLKIQADKLEKEKRLRLRSVLDTQEEERQRLSRELHDGLGPLLLTGKMKLESALTAKKEVMSATMREVMNLFSTTVQEIRNITNNINPSGLKEFGLAIALQNYCNEVMENHPVKIDVLIDLKKKHYPKKTEIYLFRIVQEAINNILKHADAREIHLNLEEIERHLYFTLQDNGCGFDTNQQPFHGGNGLVNMKERVNLLNGYFELTSTPEKGTRIDIEIPVE